MHGPADRARSAGPFFCPFLGERLAERLKKETDRGREAGMKNGMGRRILILLLCVLLCAGSPAALAQAGNESVEEWTMTKETGLPAGEWQKRAFFPAWKGYTDDTLAMNSRLSFQGYHGQGALWLEVAEGVEAFTLYVNGQKWNTAAVSAGVWRADISAVAVDGVNTLQLSGIQPMGLRDAVRVYVPYPVVLAGEELEGIRPETLRLISDIIQSDIDYGFTSAQPAVGAPGSNCCYTASTLGFVPQLLSMGLDGEADVSAQLLDLLADMAMESLKLIPGDAAADHPYVKNAQSKIAVLRAWAAARDNADALTLADAIEASLPL